MRMISLFQYSLTQRLPSGPNARLPSVREGSGYSWRTAPAGDITPRVLTSPGSGVTPVGKFPSVNHRFPSGPAVIARGCGSGVANSVI